MPWFAWIAVVGIVVWGLLALVAMITGRTMPGSEDSSEEIEELQQRIQELESQLGAADSQTPQIPTRREENLTAEDRWRLDMLEARLENLEKDRDDDGPTRPHST